MLRFLLPCVSARSYWPLLEKICRISTNVNNALSCITRPAAFELAEGRVRAFQIAFIATRDDDDTVASQRNWLMNMAPYWFVRLNDSLVWLNPALGFVAAVLALLTIAAAAERFPRNAASPAAYSSPAIYSARPVNVRPSAECARPVVPPELRDLRLYD